MLRSRWGGVRIDGGVMMAHRVGPDQGADGTRPRHGFGVAATLAHDVVREVARAAERAGYRTFWVNDEPDGDGLAALAEAASVTATIRLGVGVIPLDRQRPERIASRLRELGLPVGRLTLGVGSGRPAGGLERVREGVGTLRELPAATVVVGAVGPRMCRLAGEVADGVLFDWLTPDHAGRSAEIVERAAAEAGRPRPSIGGYVFTALGAGAIARLQREAAHYASLPAYAAHLARMGVAPMAAAVAGSDAREIRRGLAAFGAALDETVVRAVVADERSAAYLDLLAAAAPT
jgi:alkanesulfonate monooxygenase SsuD/methylene tetrahydromethanopterin reductase-like flavin-dependent oxidoreductase (luciferase family)